MCSSDLAQIRNVLLQLRDAGKTIFLNSHILQEVELVCDRVAILQQGRLRFVGPVGELARRRSDQLDVTFELSGLHEDIGHVFPDALLESGACDGRFRTVVTARQQAEIDRFVDKLRERNVSILAISPRRASLEDAFMDLLQSEAEP